MVLAAKTYQYRLTQAECQLHNLLRRLEAEFEDEFPEIFSSTGLPKLNKPFTLSLQLGGRQLEHFDLNGTHLIQDCASVGAKIVRKLLTSDEHVESPARDDTSTKLGSGDPGRVTPGLSNEPLVSVAVKEQTSWESIKQEVVPPYVKAVTFTVARSDLTPDRQEDLKFRFPDVTITTEYLPREHEDEVEVESQFAADQCLRQRSTTETAPITSWTTSTKPLSLHTSIMTVAEVIPDIPSVTDTPKLSLLSRMSIGGSEIRIKGVASGNPDNADTPTGPGKTYNKSPILSIAERIGLETTCPDKVIHAMWSQWQNNREVKPYAAVRRMINLKQYYNNLVTLYTLAHHREEFDLCFAVLLRFQSTNYTFREELPDVATIVLAFQYLPEGNDLCCWVATLFAFLWTTQQYQDREHLLADFPGLDSDAFSKFIFAIAHIRAPFTKGHNTAVLEQWCEVHHHEEGDAEEALCKEVFDGMKVQLDKIRSEEAEREYNEAKRLVDDYVKSLQSQSLSVDATQSTPLGKSKRKAESPVVQSHRKYKRGGGRGGGRGGFSRASS
ncbi:hypothetical protein BU25DRAFT_424542 [Macroventuria anomochaeta]|uniref:Uncharacterized protein n=1 Tax=Macroventuria anomochaeta TaxID=301207 RepID=A0ACB6RQ47_9PLEO|nr:uncharacterized protein BU25DRAFT_424542 [Macroventuria anomochaeta]KAF2623863.1 hypothetical protein BU25DRAFT_424542 [Macroventuria anomochaeta]